MKTIYILIYAFLISGFASSELLSNVPPPLLRLDVNIDGKWKTPEGKVFVIKGSTRDRRFTITPSDSDSEPIYAYVERDGSVFYFRTDQVYSCTVENRDTIMVSPAEGNDGKKAQWVRIGAAPDFQLKIN